MPDPRLDQLFAGNAFLRDLPGIVQLPPNVLADIAGAITSRLRQGVDPVQETDVTRIVAAYNIPLSAVRGAFALSAFIGSLLAASEVRPAEISAKVEQALGSAAPGLTSFREHIGNLEKLSTDFRTFNERRTILSDGGKTVNYITVATDLRVRSTPADLLEIDIDNFRPEVIELVPVVNVKVSFASTDDGDDIVFQLSPAELTALIKQLRIAEAEVAAAQAQVRLHPRA